MMEAKRISSNNRCKKLKRTEVLEKKKAIDEAINAAYAEKDHLASFPQFFHYNRNGLSVYLESGFGEKLSSPMKQYIQSLLKVNMEGPYGPEWLTEEKVKRREMVSREARYIFVRKASDASINAFSLTKKEVPCTRLLRDGDPVVGFLQYRFIVEEEIPVLYVYELQLEPCVQGRGLGKFLMQLVELIAHKYRMGAVMLTVRKANLPSVNFYTSKLRYMISSISPSRVDPLREDEKSYEILCKAFDHEAKVQLEEGNCSGDD